MSENKQESGYQRASFTAQPLNGAIPKAAPLSADNWARGDLRAAFKAPPAAPKLSLADLPQRPANVPDKDENDAATRQARDSKNKNTATTPLNMTATTPRNDARAEETKIAALTPSALKPPPGLIPPQFAPVMLAGALSAKLQEKAARIADGPDDYKQGDEFNTNKLSGFNKRRYLERVEESMDGDKNTARQNEQKMLLAYAAEQQRQEFMRSIEYSVALNTVNNSIRELEGERTQAYARKAELQQELAALDSNIQTASAEVGVMEATKEGLVELKSLKEENKADQDKTMVLFDKNDELRKPVDDLWSRALKIDGDKIIVTKMENGVPVKYAIDENGKQIKCEDSGFYMPHQTVFLKKDAQGNAQLVRPDGSTFSDEDAKKINKALEAANIKAVDVTPAQEDYAKASQKYEAKAKSEKATSADINKAMTKEEESRAKLEEQAQKIGFPVENLHLLDGRIDELSKSIENKKKQIEEWQTSKTKTAEELQAAQEHIARIERQLAESTKFKQDLENGTFKNKAEMEAQMPRYLKLSYEANLQQKKADNNFIPATTATLDNTSRANGSAVAAYEGTPGTGGISNDFKAAATNAPVSTAAEPAPAAPAPTDNMEFIAARQQPKAQGLGLN